VVDADADACSVDRAWCARGAAFVGSPIASRPAMARASTTSVAMTILRMGRRTAGR
jgi:hypothetical protein